MGQRTKFMELPTQLVMNAMSGERRWKRIAVLSIVGMVVAGGVGGAVMYVLGANEQALLHKSWADAQGCMLGAPLAQGETVGARVRLLQMANIGLDPTKRPVENGKSWPASCTDKVDAIAQHALSAEGGGQDLANAAKGLLKVLAQGDEAADLRKPVEDLWKAAATASLKDPPAAAGFTTPKPPQLSFPQLTTLPKLLGADGLGIGTLVVETSTSRAVRFLVDDKGIPSGPVVCTAGDSDALACARVSADAAAQSPGLRLVGASEPTSQAFVFAGDRGKAGVFRGPGKPLLTDVTTYGASVDESGKGALLVRVGSSPDLTVKQQAAPGADAVDAGSLSHTLLDNLNDATIAGGYLVYRSPPSGSAPSHLFVRAIGDMGAATDIGEIPDGLAPSHDLARYSTCKVGGTLAIRVRASRTDFVALAQGGRFSAPAKVPDAARGGTLTCREGEAWIAKLDPGSETERVHSTVDVVKCTPGTCAAAGRVSVFDLVHGSRLGLPQDKDNVAAVMVDGKLLVVWNAGTTGGLRARFAPVDRLATTEDTLLADDVDASSGQSAVLGVRALSAGSVGVVLLHTSSGVRTLRVAADGHFSPMSATF